MLYNTNVKYLEQRLAHSWDLIKFRYYCSIIGGYVRNVCASFYVAKHFTRYFQRQRGKKKIIALSKVPTISIFINRTLTV